MVERTEKSGSLPIEDEMEAVYRDVDPYRYVVSGRQHVTAGFVRNLLLTREKDALSFLELASGEGALTEAVYSALSGFYFDYTGVDVCQTSLDRALKKGFQNFTSVKQDLSLPTWDFGSKDVIIASDVLPYLSLEDGYSLIQRCWSNLRPRGILVLTTWFSFLSEDCLDEPHFRYLPIFSDSGSVQATMKWRGFALGTLNGKPPCLYPTGGSYMAARKNG